MDKEKKTLNKRIRLWQVIFLVLILIVALGIMRDKRERAVVETQEKIIQQLQSQIIQKDMQIKSLSQKVQSAMGLLNSVVKELDQ